MFLLVAIFLKFPSVRENGKSVPTVIFFLYLEDNKMQDKKIWATGL